jgi:hypothetical protein
MVIFIVATRHPNNDDPLKNRITENFPSAHYEIGRGQWLVAFNGTSKELYDKILPDDSPSGVTVFATSGYYGVAPQDMWEWIATKLKG